MRRMSTNQFNELWKNARLTVTTVLFPILGIFAVLYTCCKPVHNYVDMKIEEFIEKRKEKKAKKDS